MNQVAVELKNLSDDVHFWCNNSSNLSFIEEAATIHHRLVFIHPFLNENGRFSRLVSDRYLKAYKLPFPNWLIDLGKDGKHRKSYIKALQEADQGNLEPLVSYMKKYMIFEKNISSNILSMDQKKLKEKESLKNTVQSRNDTNQETPNMY